MTLREGLVFVRDALIGIGARDQIRIDCSGKIVNSFDMAVALARSGLVQFGARVHGLHPVPELPYRPLPHWGHDKTRSRALAVEDKTERVRNCHRSMLSALAELTAAAGLEHPQDFHPEDFSRRVSEREMMTVGELYPTPVSGELLIGALNPAVPRRQFAAVRCGRVPC